jgi:hypothetical protein
MEWLVPLWCLEFEFTYPIIQALGLACKWLRWEMGSGCEGITVVHYGKGTGQYRDPETNFIVIQHDDGFVKVIGKWYYTPDTLGLGPDLLSDRGLGIIQPLTITEQEHALSRNMLL